MSREKCNAYWVKHFGHDLEAEELSDKEMFRAVLDMKLLLSGKPSNEIEDS